jgi:DNA polymerase-4
MDSFFVSVELLRRPDLRGKPVAVGDPGPRGVVASASYEARAFGVRSAMPSSRARRLCPPLVFLSGAHGEYSAWSRKVREILLTRSPLVDAASIDEFYLDLTGCQRLHGDFLAMACRLREEIQGSLGLPSSMGLAANRTLAKIASKVAKPRGVMEVLPGGERDFMAPLPVRLIPGVGPVCETTLSRLGIRTAGDLAAIPPGVLRRALGSWGPELSRKARGEWRGSRLPLPEAAPRSIGHETTFAEDTTDPLFLERVLFSLAERGAVRLRRRNLEAGRVTVRVRFADFRTESRTAPLVRTFAEQALVRAALPLLRTLTSRRMRVRLLGLTLSDLSPSLLQEDLFAPPDRGRRREACRCLDRVKDRFGFDALRWAAGTGGRS